MAIRDPRPGIDYPPHHPDSPRAPMPPPMPPGYGDIGRSPADMELVARKNLWIALNKLVTEATPLLIRLLEGAQHGDS